MARKRNTSVTSKRSVGVSYLAGPGPADDYWYQPRDGSYRVNSTTAEKVTVWFACIRIIAQTMAGLPKLMYRATADDQRERVRDHPLGPTLADQPNVYQTSFEFWEYMFEQVLSRGAAFAIPGPLPGGFPLIPIPTDAVTVKLNTQYQKVYAVRDARGIESLYPPDELFRILWFTPDGISWKDPLVVMADQLSSADSATVYVSRFFKNAAMPGGVLETDKPYNETGSTELRNNWHGIHGGPENAGRTAVLWNGMKYSPLSPSMKDIEMTAIQKASTATIAIFFGVPLDMVGDMTGAKFANVEHKAIGFVQDTILPWCKRIEGATSRDLIVDPAVFMRCNIDGLLRADFQTRMMGYASAVGAPIMTPNEARKLENLPPLPGGDDFAPPPNASLPAPGAEPDEDEPPPEPEPRDEGEEANNHLMKKAADRIAAIDWKQTGAKSYVVKQLEPIYRLRLNDGHQPETPLALYGRIVGIDSAQAILDHLRRAYGGAVVGH